MCYWVNFDPIYNAIEETAAQCSKNDLNRPEGDAILAVYLWYSIWKYENAINCFYYYHVNQNICFLQHPVQYKITYNKYDIMYVYVVKLWIKWKLKRAMRKVRSRQNYRKMLPRYKNCCYLKWRTDI